MPKPEQKIWNPKGGEFEIMPMIVEIDELTGPVQKEETPRPDSGNEPAKRAMAAISLDFIMGRPLDPRKLARLERVLPVEAQEPFAVVNEHQAV